MKRSKKTLKFKKIRIANMNFIKGGGDTDSPASGENVCQSGVACPPPHEATTPGNPCSDGCYASAVRPNQNSVVKDECYLGYCLN